jgi:hypothetical protein
MTHNNSIVADLLETLDLGSSVAELDSLLEVARVETSAFSDLVHDRVDLIPGTKGSGKSALFRIFVDFLPDSLLAQRKVVVAHGVQAPGDPVFHAFADRFSKLSEEDFVDFWCIYLVSLAHEQFIKGPRYKNLLKEANAEVVDFRNACANAGIPEVSAKKSLLEILEWSLNALRQWKPKIKYKLPGEAGDMELDLFGSATQINQEASISNDDLAIPKYINKIKETLDAVLNKSRLSLWLMVDRLDEVFPRRSEQERKALRGLLRAMRYFSAGNIRVKVFLRDDMLDHIVRTSEGFTALTHLTARKSDTLCWTSEQILTMLVKRIFASANANLAEYLGIDRDQIEASAKYRAECFDRVFPPTVYRGSRQSPTLRWIFNRCADGRNVVTPRDVLDLVIRAKQKQQDICTSEPDGNIDYIIDSSAIRYGYEELSKHKCQTYLQAEFPHLWSHIDKFVGGKTEYNESTLRAILGKDWKKIAEDLVAIGFLSKATKPGQALYSIPFLYRHSLDVTQGKA